MKLDIFFLFASSIFLLLRRRRRRLSAALTREFCELAAFVPSELRTSRLSPRRRLTAVALLSR